MALSSPGATSTGRPAISTSSPALPNRCLDFTPRSNARSAPPASKCRLLGPSGGFARLVVADGSDTTDVDLAHDYRLLPPEETAVGRTLAAEELAIDKVLALFDRAEARDFVDLAAVVDRWGLPHLCRRANEKDAGFSTELLADQLDRFDRLPAQDFGVPEEERTRLRGVVRVWQLQLREPPSRGPASRGRSR